MAFVRAIVLAYEKYATDPRPALRRAGIAPAQLRARDARIDASQMETISATAMQELDDEALGWFSRRLPWGSYGMLCRASLTSPTLGVALQRWCRHHRLLTEDVTLQLRVSGSTAWLGLEENRELGAVREFCLVTLLRYVHGYTCWAVNSQLPLLEAAFPFSAPRHHASYTLMFPGPVRFDAERASLCFDARYLSLPLTRDERALRQMLQRALPLTVHQYRRDRLLVQRVREQLALEGARGDTAAELARSLHVSVRSLHRQLQQEGASLQTLKDEVRRARAIELLTRTQLSVKQVAAAVGFHNEKSFARAFRQWTGQPPTALRRASSAAG